jgi:hypothetical protein
MAQTNTILSRLLKLVPRHEFEVLENQHHCGRSFRTISRWFQFVVMIIGQLAGRVNLRNIVDNVCAQSHRLYHLRTYNISRTNISRTNLSRTNLSRINSDKPYQLYEALFLKLFKRCKKVLLEHNFRFKNPLYSLDASNIDLCLSPFPWAHF